MHSGNIRKVGALLGLGEMHERGDWLHAHCPFAAEKHRSGADHDPSFGIKVARGGSHYWCFTCKSAGPLHYLPTALQIDGAQSLTFEIIRLEAEEGFAPFENAAPEELPEPLNEAAFGNLFPPAWETAPGRDYLRYRGVSEYAAYKIGIGYDPEDLRVVFPVRDEQGLLYGYTGRTVLINPADYPSALTRGGFKYQKSKDYFGLKKKYRLLGAQFLRENPNAVVVEGPIDMAVGVSRLEGEPYSVVGLLGSYLSPWQRDALINNGKSTFGFGDCDEAGDILIYGVDGKPGFYGQLISELPVYIPLYPETVIDPTTGKPSAEPDPGMLTREQWLYALEEAAKVPRIEFAPYDKRR